MTDLDASKGEVYGVHGGRGSGYGAEAVDCIVDLMLLSNLGRGEGMPEADAGFNVCGRETEAIPRKLLGDVKPIDGLMTTLLRVFPNVQVSPAVLPRQRAADVNNAR